MREIDMVYSSTELRERLATGVVIPAVPLALNANREFDASRQRALMRYYCDAGAGGIAVGMHFTQFAIRRPGIGLYEPVLKACAEAVRAWCPQDRPMLVAGIDGDTASARQQAEQAKALGYDLAIVSLAKHGGALPQEMVAHVGEVAKVMPVMGFYLLTGVGGIQLPYDFWRRLLELPELVGIKIAPFNRYGTIEVMRAFADSMREDVSCYCGNDESILHDLITPFRFASREVRMRGGLLGQWACWTKRAVEFLDEIRRIADGGEPVTPEVLSWAARMTDANGAIFDAAHDFAGSIPGVNEILRRQGFFEGIWTLDPDEVLAPGQFAEIDRVCGAYPDLNDNAFVAENLSRWLAE